MLIHLLAQTAEYSLQEILTAELAPREEAIEIWIIAVRLSCAALVGWVLGLGYRLSYTGKKLRPTMHHTLVMLCLGGALVWLVVGDSLVRAFGLAGTIGLIRYRTTLRDPKDTTVLFFSMVLGMALGLGHYPTAIIGCLFVFGALVVMRLTYTPPPPKVKAYDGDAPPPDAVPGEPRPFYAEEKPPPPTA